MIWPIGWNWSTDFFCRLIRVYVGLRQYFSEGVKNFIHWHFFKSNMAAATPQYHQTGNNSLIICGMDIIFDSKPRFMSTRKLLEGLFVRFYIEIKHTNTKWPPPTMRYHNNGHNSVNNCAIYIILGSTPRV